MLNNQQIQNNWPQIKSQVLSKWSKLAETDVEATHGDATSLGNLVNRKYGTHEEFNKTYEKICTSCIPSEKNTTSKQADGIPDFEERSRTAPSAEAGNHAQSTENFSRFDKAENFNREMDDEISAYSSDTRKVDNEENVQKDEFDFNNDTDLDTHFSAPDEFTPSQNPTPSREDITLGRNTSSATKISTAKAAPISSEASNDA